MFCFGKEERISAPGRSGNAEKNHKYALELRYEMHEKEFGYDIMCDFAGRTSAYLTGETFKSEYNGRKCEYPAGNPVYQFTLYRESDTGFFCVTVFISASFYLSRSFENAIGKSIYQYVLEKRMIMARQLLISGEKPTDIFSLCGFGQYSNFLSCFLKNIIICRQWHF